MRWIHKLEYKYGRYYIRNLMPILAVAMVVVYLGDFIVPGGVSGWLSFWRESVLAGQVWRVISFILLPPGGALLPPIGVLNQVNSTMSPVFILLSIYFIFMAGRFLESHWGGFRLNLYYFIGFLMALLGGFITPLGITTNSYLHSSLYLALATIMPDMQIRLFLIIPIKGIWFIVLFFGMNLFTIIRAFLTPIFGVTLGLSHLILFVLSLVNYFLFFGPTLVSNAKQQLTYRRNRRQWRNRNN